MSKYTTCTQQTSLIYSQYASVYTYSHMCESYVHVIIDSEHTECQQGEVIAELHEACSKVEPNMAGHTMLTAHVM